MKYTLLFIAVVLFSCGNNEKTSNKEKFDSQVDYTKIAMDYYKTKADSVLILNVSDNTRKGELKALMVDLSKIFEMISKFEMDTTTESGFTDTVKLWRRKARCADAEYKKITNDKITGKHIRLIKFYKNEEMIAKTDTTDLYIGNDNIIYSRESLLYSPCE